MVFYRKYRPQKIDDLDSSSIREMLYSVLQKNVSHAFLFTGPKGLGKTSTARIVAKVVNCTTPKTKRENGVEPCDICDQCVSIKNGTNIDILEIDAASNRGIDEIRELKEKIRLAPVAASRKVYIIDEVHMLTTEAFNALLKTLEEPPAHAMFILCTTEVHKVPETIMSRCFQILFKPATQEELVRSFKRIIDGEKIKIEKGKEDEILLYIAKISDRGFRDGAKILEEISLMAQDKDITIPLIESTFKTTKIATYVVGLLSALGKGKKDTKKALEIIENIVNDGIDIKYFINTVIEKLHEELLIKMEIIKEPSILEVSFSVDELKLLTEMFTSVYGEIKNAVLLQLPLELAVIEWGDGSQEPVVQKKQQLAEGNQQNWSSGSGASTVNDLRKQVGTMKKLKALQDKKEEEDTIAQVASPTVELMQTNGDGPVTNEWIELFWKNYIIEMKKYNHTVAGVLRGCNVKSYADQNLIIQTSYKFHKERLDDIKNRDALLKIGKLLTGKDVTIKVELRSKD
jgi:DNA polymerase-3 subunit gamma/tau